MLIHQICGVKNTVNEYTSLAIIKKENAHEADGITVTIY